MRRFRAASAFTALGVVAVLGRPALGDVNLELRTTSDVIQVGETVEVGLYAVSSDGSDQGMAAMDVIVVWDPAVLRLIGKRDDGPYAWMMSYFPNDSQLDGLNADCGADVFCSLYTGLPFNDGDMMYEAVAPFALDPAPIATAEGLLVTTLLFQAEGRTPATELRILPSVGIHASTTKVIDAEGLGDATGELGALTLILEACGFWGDFDNDCAVGPPDYPPFWGCFDGPGGHPLSEGCEAAKMDADDDADLFDYAMFQRFFAGP